MFLLFLDKFEKCFEIVFLLLLGPSNKCLKTGENKQCLETGEKLCTEIRKNEKCIETGEFFLK